MIESGKRRVQSLILGSGIWFYEKNNFIKTNKDRQLKEKLKYVSVKLSIYFLSWDDVFRVLS